MEKIISIREVASIKKMAQIVNPLVSKKQTLLKKIAEMVEMIEGPEGLDVQIAGMEAGIKAKCLGLGTEQLIKKVVSPAVHPDGTPAIDAKTGKQLTKTTWEPTDLLKFNEEKNYYVLTLEENQPVSAVPTKEEVAEYNQCEPEEIAQEPQDENPFAL